MLKMIEHALIFAALPFLFLAGLVFLMNVTWETIGIIIAIPATLMIGGFLYGFVSGFVTDEDGKRRREQERRAVIDEAHRALVTGRPDDVPPNETASPAVPPKALPAPQKRPPAPYGNQWRGTLK